MPFYSKCSCLLSRTGFLFSSLWQNEVATKGSLTVSSYLQLEHPFFSKQNRLKNKNETSKLFLIWDVVALLSLNSSNLINVHILLFLDLSTGLIFIDPLMKKKKMKTFAHSHYCSSSNFFHVVLIIVLVYSVHYCFKLSESLFPLSSTLAIFYDFYYVKWRN